MKNKKLDIKVILFIEYIITFIRSSNILDILFDIFDTCIGFKIYTNIFLSLVLIMCKRFIKGQE